MYVDGERGKTTFGDDGEIDIGTSISTRSEVKLFDILQLTTNR